MCRDKSTFIIIKICLGKNHGNFWFIILSDSVALKWSAFNYEKSSGVRTIFLNPCESFKLDYERNPHSTWEEHLQLWIETIPHKSQFSVNRKIYRPDAKIFHPPRRHLDPRQTIMWWFYLEDRPTGNMNGNELKLPLIDWPSIRFLRGWLDKQSAMDLQGDCPLAISSVNPGYGQFRLQVRLETKCYKFDYSINYHIMRKCSPGSYKNLVCPNGNDSKQ